MLGLLSHQGLRSQKANCQKRATFNAERIVSTIFFCKKGCTDRSIRETKRSLQPCCHPTRKEYRMVRGITKHHLCCLVQQVIPLEINKVYELFRATTSKHIYTSYLQVSDRVTRTAMSKSSGKRHITQCCYQTLTITE